MPHAALPIWDIEHRQLEKSCQLHSAIHGFLSGEDHFSIGLNYPEDVGAGVRDYHFQRLLPQEGRIHSCIVAIHLRPVQFKFHKRFHSLLGLPPLSL